MQTILSRIIIPKWQKEMGRSQQGSEITKTNTQDVKNNNMLYTGENDSVDLRKRKNCWSNAFEFLRRNVSYSTSEGVSFRQESELFTYDSV